MKNGHISLPSILLSLLTALCLLAPSCRRESGKVITLETLLDEMVSF